MATIAFRSPVTVPLLRFGAPKPVPPDPRAHDTFRITKRSRDPDPGGPGGKHLAIDFGNFRCGDPIVAMAPGKARRAHDAAKADGAPTNALGIIIDHGSGVHTEYWHLSAFKVADGADVVAGTVIGLVGMTGNADGCHCHLELKIDGVRVDPEPHAFGRSLQVGPATRRVVAVTPGGTDMALAFRAADYRPITNRKFLTDISANFRAAPNTGAAVLKKFPGNTTVIPSGVVKGQTVNQAAPRAGFVANEWFEARMPVGTKVLLGYFHASVLTAQTPVE